MHCDYNISIFLTTKITAIMAQQTLNYSTSYLNRNYLFKVSGDNGDGVKLNKLVGVSGLVSLIGVELVNKFVARAERDGQDACYCRLRRGLRVTLYSH